MHYIVMMVLHHVEQLDDVLNAWEAAGAPGITVLFSTGLGRIRTRTALREDMPLIPNLADLLSPQHEEMYNRTIFSIVDSETIVDQVIKSTEAVLGDLSRPDNGIIAVLPLARVVGLRRHNSEETNDYENPID